MKGKLFYMILMKADKKIEAAKKAVKNKEETYIFENTTYHLSFIQRIAMFMYCNLFLSVCTYSFFGLKNLFYMILFCSVFFFLFPLVLFELNSRSHVLN